MSVSTSPPMFLQFFVPGTNQPAVGYQLFTYQAGTSIKQATWTNYTQTVQNTNPVIADANGVMQVWIDPTLKYKYLFTSKNDSDPPTSPIYSVDNINLNSPILNWVSVLSYGADPSGLSDSSTAFQNALNSGASFVVAPPPNSGAKYIVHDVTIPSGVTLFSEGAYFVDAPGSNWVLKLTGFNTKLIGGQISSATNCAQAAIIVDDGNWCEVRSFRVINATTVIRLQSSSNGANGFGCSRTQLLDIIGVSFTVGGVDSAANCHDTQATNIYMDCGTVAGGGGQIPRAGVYGFRFVGTGSTVAFGGHQYNNCNAINMQTGWLMTDTNLIKLTNCIADTLSGVGYLLNGSTNQIDLDTCFAGTCAGAVVGAGTSSQNHVRDLRSNAIGVIPGFGGTTWYSSAGFSAPFYDIQQQDTAKLTVDLDSWHAVGSNAHSFLEAVAFNITFTGGIRIPFNSNTTVAAGSTVYLGINAQSATEDPQRVLCPIQVIANAARCVLDCNAAPGAGQSFSYTLRVNGADSAITGTTSGAGVFTATVTGGPVGITANTDVDIKLVTSGGATTAIHRGYLLLLPQPG